MVNLNDIPMSFSFDDFLLRQSLSLVSSRKEINIKTRILGADFAFPFIPANMSTVTGYKMALKIMDMNGLPILHRFMPQDQLVETIVNLNSMHKFFGISIGFDEFANESLFTELNRYAIRGADMACVIDVAHGFHGKMPTIIGMIKHYMPLAKIVAGNVSTYAGAMFLLGQLKVDCIKVGVGGGSLCTTRVKTGCGNPQLSAIMEACAARDDAKRGAVIADGGIKNSGDVVKALAAGADAVMMGSVFAGTDESPGDVMTLGSADQKRVKIFSGMASHSVQSNSLGKQEKDLNVEGVSTLVDYKGPVESVINRLAAGLRSGMSYCGCRDLAELRKYGAQQDSWIRVSPLAFREGLPHGAIDH